MAKMEKIPDYKKDKKRLDGRKMDETRPMSIKTGVIPNADGSAYIEWGQNKVYAGVYGPRECLPRHTARPDRAVIKAVYRMATFSVPDRKNPRPNRRDMEISKVISEALTRAVFVEQYPNTQIDVSVEVMDSNAGSRVACLVAASVALADAGLPMRDLVSATGVGKAFNEIVLDLNKAEEDAPDAVDIPIAILPNSEEIVLLQMDGLLKPSEWKECVKLGIKGCKDIYEIQKKALTEGYNMCELGKAKANGKKPVAKKESKKTIKKKVKK